MRRCLACSLFLATLILALAAPGWGAPLPVRAVVVTFWQLRTPGENPPGERHLWLAGDQFPQTLPFPQGEWDLGYNPKDRTLLLTTGMGSLNATASVLALGMDRRFDLSRAYWVCCGIAGGDPEDASLGSVAVARYVVDSDLSTFLDPREMPRDFSTGTLPLLRDRPFAPPPKDQGELFPLNPDLARWAYRAARDMPLEETEGMRRQARLYRGYPQAQRKPFVLMGDALAGDRFWHGALSNEWANQWMRYFTEDKGNFVATAMEDAGVLLALRRLARSGLADPDRAVVLRALSNFSMQWPGGTARDSLLSGWDETGEGVEASTRNVHAAGSAVLRALLDRPPLP